VACDEVAEAVDRGRANAKAIELTSAHCRHARVTMVSGNSTIGAAVDLPLGRMEIRCEHAPPPRTQSYDAMALATEFYRENCIACPHRDGTGFPNLKNEVEKQDAAHEQRRRKQEARQAALAARRAARFRRRRLAVASEGKAHGSIRP
jgi:hypothetical protein